MNPRKRPDVQDVIRKIESVKRNVMSDTSVQTAWETLNTIKSDQRISVDEKTMVSRDIVKELTFMNLNAQNAPKTDRTGLHSQKMSNLCVYFATMSAIRHEMKKVFENLTSTAVNINNNYGSEYPTDAESIPIPAGKSIDELFNEKEFQFFDRNETFKNALNFERMLAVLIGCVSPPALSGLGKTINMNIEIILFFTE